MPTDMSPQTSESDPPEGEEAQPAAAAEAAPDAPEAPGAEGGAPEAPEAEGGADGPASEGDEAAADAAEEENVPGRPGGLVRHVRPLVLGAVAVVVGVAGVVATVSAHDARAAASAQNVALADRAATAQVRRQVSTTINTIFTYSYTDTARTRHAAQGLLTGQAIHQYNSLFALVERSAPAEKLQVTTRVTNTGVEFLTGGRARVLVFANQQDTVAGTHQTSYAGAMLAVTVVRMDGRWKIENMDTFTAGG